MEKIRGQDAEVVTDVECMSSISRACSSGAEAERLEPAVPSGLTSGWSAQFARWPRDDPRHRRMLAGSLSTGHLSAGRSRRRKSAGERSRRSSRCGLQPVPESAFARMITPA